MIAAMRILVTGAAGYIGSALVKALAGSDVVATDQSPPAPVIGNLAYPQFARSLITAEISAVFHLASLVSGGAEQNFELGTKVNLDATRDLLEACRLAGHCPKFVFASSVAVHGGADEVTDDTDGAAAFVRRAEARVRDPDRRLHPARLHRRLRVAPARRARASGRREHRRVGLVERDHPRAARRPGLRLPGASGYAPCLHLHPEGGAAFLHAARLGAQGTVLLNGFSASAQEMWDAVRPRAGGKVRFAPDPVVQAVMDGAPKRTSSERATRLGFPQSRNIDEIVREYEETSVAHHG